MSEQLATSSQPVSSQAALTARASSERSLTILGYLDLVGLAVAVPVALALGAPAVGVLVSACGWLLQRLLAGSAKRWIAAQGANARFGLSFVDAFGRIWLLAGAIVAAALIGGRKDGLTAALMIFGLYSLAFAMRLVKGRPQGDPGR